MTGLHEVDEAVALLTRGNLRLVLWMAKKYRAQNAFFLDMVQEGNMGLARAARKFDHRKGAGFGTYANWWVRQSIERYLSHHSRTIRIPVTVRPLCVGYGKRFGCWSVRTAKCRRRNRLPR